MSGQVLPTASSAENVETILRSVTTELGSSSGLAMAPLDRVTCENFGKLKAHIVAAARC